MKFDNKYSQTLNERRLEIAHENVSIAIIANLTNLYLFTLRSTKIISIIAIIAILLGAYLTDNIPEPQLGDIRLNLLFCIASIPLIVIGLTTTIIISFFNIIRIIDLLCQSLPMRCGFILLIISLVVQSYSLKTSKDSIIWKIFHYGSYLSMIIYLSGLIIFIH